MNKYTNPKLCSLPDAADLRASLAASESTDIRKQLAMLFDTQTFIETSAYTVHGFSDFINTETSAEFEGVITGYGAIDGELVFAFAEDSSRMGGVIDERHAKKIIDLYSLAMSNGAPVIGIFNSNGTDIFAGTAGLAAYGRIISAVSNASGNIPQIAYICGKCIGTAAAIASMFDIIVKTEGSDFYVNSPNFTGKKNAQDSVVSYSGSHAECASFIRTLLSFLPDNCNTGIQVTATPDNLNRLLADLDFAGDALSMISAISDNAIFYELNKGCGDAATVAFASIGGVKCGVVATSYSVNEGRLTSSASKKISKFVNLCNAYSLPIVTLVDSMGLSNDKDNEEGFASDLAKLAFAYSCARCPKVTVIMGHAIGASFVLLGSKALGADLVYALDYSEIGALPAASGVAFAWDKYITEEKTREEFINEWRESVSSPVNAAASGEIDDIISVNELRARICSALLMLSSKNKFRSQDRKALPF